jgi:hypothetical protein
MRRAAEVTELPASLRAPITLFAAGKKYGLNWLSSYFEIWDFKPYDFTLPFFTVYWERLCEALD